ncbi:MAG TPA: hypothetical protein VFP93_00695 [Gammaproteobacteria bacterium]|nr:hypothetical protein [Gammaproteobacteria bacterium]
MKKISIAIAMATSFLLAGCAYDGHYYNQHRDHKVKCLLKECPNKVKCVFKQCPRAKYYKPYAHQCRQCPMLSNYHHGGYHHYK